VTATAVATAATRRPRPRRPILMLADCGQDDAKAGHCLQARGRQPPPGPKRAAADPAAGPAATSSPARPPAPNRWP